MDNVTQVDDIVNDAVAALLPLNPKSIFLYGSRTRGDANEDRIYVVQR